MLETITSALVAFFDAQRPLLDQVPQLGHIPKIFQSMLNKNEAVLKSAIQITHQLAGSDVCIRAMAQCQCVGPMKAAMKVRRDQIGLACEALMKMFDLGEDELVEQVTVLQA